ncbi:ABC-type multidrug transport system fused ATPase/permease subunit [Anaerotaenia torta]|uniref:ABC transporter ATP-binding protein n=1 Tax=Anaerotaenia torta TaxID=433293 RepID=UPI003D2421E4
MNRIQALVKAFKVSMKIKGPVSMIISLLGFPAALLPVLLAQRLRVLTDELQILSGTRGSAAPALTVFATLVGLYFVQIMIINIQQYTNGFDEIKIQRYINRTIMRHKCEVRYKYIENYDDFHKRIAFTHEYAGRTMARCIGSMITILQLFVAFVGASMALWSINPFIVITLFITSVPAAILAYFQQEETFRGRAKWMEEGALAIHYYHILSPVNTFNGLQEIRHFALFDYLKARWRAIADEYIHLKNKIMVRHVKFNTAADFLRSAVYIGILLIAAWEIYENPAIGLGSFTLVFALSGQLQTVTGDCLVGIMVLAQNIPYMKEFFYLEELEREQYDENSTIAETGDIFFVKVGFSYPNSDVEVLKDITIHIKNGEKIAVVGENGSGKSTFISLLCGMFDPKTGYITIDGNNVSENPAAVRNAVSVVFQDFAHYEASLRENITVSDKKCTATDDEIMDLLKKINVNDVVEEQRYGLNELVGSFSEKANNLSGGQWQKISIARAAYRQDAKIMILDEPTSALDPVAEAQLYRNFASLTGNKTTILISHRLGITAMVDRILVFKDGRIVEDGSHKTLMAQNGHYADMYRAQAQWYQ